MFQLTWSLVGHHRLAATQSMCLDRRESEEYFAERGKNEKFIKNVFGFLFLHVFWCFFTIFGILTHLRVPVERIFFTTNFGGF